MTEAIVIHRPTVGVGVDEQGNPNAGTEQQIASDGWAVAPLTADEDSLATGQQVIDGYTLFRRGELVDVRPDDRVSVRGEVYAVAASRAQWVHPHRSAVGTVVTVRRVG